LSFGCRNDCISQHTVGFAIDRGIWRYPVPDHYRRAARETIRAEQEIEARLHTVTQELHPFLTSGYGPLRLLNRFRTIHFSGGQFMAMAGDFFTPESLGTLAGATSATLAISNTIQHIFNVNPRWLAFGVAEAICLGLVAVLQIDGASPVTATAWFIAVLNGFLVLCSAAGLTSIGNKALGTTDTRKLESIGERRRFWMPWF
jgi:hypothetical protein